MSNTIWAFGVDPGVTTGWAAIGVPAPSIFGSAPSQILDWQCGQLDGPLSGHIVSIRAIAKRFFPAAIICEGFDPREANRSEDYLSPVRVESMLIFAVATGYIPLVTGPFSQMPGLASSTATDYRLQKWGLYKKGSKDARSATRHAITFIRRAKDLPELRRDAWPESARA